MQSISMMAKALVACALVAGLAACAGSASRTSDNLVATLAADLPPHETSVDLAQFQGEWTGTASLVREVKAPGQTRGCSNTLRLTWIVEGSTIRGTSINPRKIEIPWEASIDPRGRWSGKVTSKFGKPTPLNGWFRGDRGVGHLMPGEPFYCLFRIDVTKAQ